MYVLLIVLMGNSIIKHLKDVLAHLDSSGMVMYVFFAMVVKLGVLLLIPVYVPPVDSGMVMLASIHAVVEEYSTRSVGNVFVQLVIGMEPHV
jgi:hypothetical protein